MRARVIFPRLQEEGQGAGLSPLQEVGAADSCATQGGRATVSDIDNFSIGEDLFKTVFLAAWSAGNARWKITTDRDGLGEAENGGLREHELDAALEAADSSWTTICNNMPNTMKLAFSKEEYPYVPNPCGYCRTDLVDVYTEDGLMDWSIGESETLLKIGSICVKCNSFMPGRNN